MISVNWKRWTYSSQDNNYKCTMDLSSPGGTVGLLGTLLVNSCFSLLLRHTERQWWRWWRCHTESCTMMIDDGGDLATVLIDFFLAFPLTHCTDRCGWQWRWTDFCDYDDDNNRGERIVFWGPNTNTNIIRFENINRIRIRIFWYSNIIRILFE